ncbi:MAG: stage II sporulation protein M [Candidatus Brockarchaeota archaeon]|nr:stage II sporulation protein M [Candidatus Brockarchaeota archaeon]
MYWTETIPEPPRAPEPPPPLYAPPQLPPSPPFNVCARYATLGTLLNVSYWMWRLNPSATVPAMLSGAVDVVKQSAVIAVFMVTISRLASEGVLDRLAEAISSGDAFKALGAASSPQIVSSIVWAVSVSVALYYAVSVVGGGFVNSAEYGSYLQLVRTGRLSVSDVVENSGGRWVEMAWTVMVTEALKYGPLAASLLWIFTSGVESAVLGGAGGVLSKALLWLAVLAAACVATVALLALTVYAYPAAANGKYGFSAIKDSVRVCKAFPGKTAAYLMLRGSSFLAIAASSYAASLFSVQVSSVAAALASLVAVPVLHALKTAIYVRGEPQPVVIPLPVGPPVIGDAPRYVLKKGVEGVRVGLRELAIFLSDPGNLPYHLISASTFAAGVAAGKQVSSSGLGRLVRALGYESGRVNPAFRGFAIPFLAVDISFHNWQVSLATALSGLALAVPTLITMMFNGFILGLVGSLVPDLAMFLAAILPHGIVELPAFVVSGSVGLRLSVRFLKALGKGGASSRSEVHDAARQAIYAVLGLVPLFLLAGFVEAFATPLIMRSYGWK